MSNIFIDGTWNVPEDKSNVYKLYELYGGTYFSGPGTMALVGDNPFISRWLGGAFGFGTSAIVDKAYNTLTGETGEINLFGFSRGAAAARMLAAKLAEEGRIVSFLGCFDTVGSFGIPINILGIPFQTINLFKDMKVHDNVLRAGHAMAADEKRGAFQNTGMEVRDGIAQRHFRGDHWHVGSSDTTYHWMIDQWKGETKGILASPSI